MAKYTLIKDSYVNIIIESDNYTMTKFFDIHIMYDNVHENKFYQKIAFPINQNNLVTNIPIDSSIYCIEIETGFLKITRHTFTVFTQVVDLNIKFKNGKKYPRISINDKLADTKEEISKCVLM
ncbi:hypothetical protein [Acanthamoeba polyphaga mimivirus]|uniref:Uncharacterized protein n=4 Tax=Megamimivirinae TaxID=3044648 RepID=A0A2L2DNW0_MIMIV|nr:hypothetical protein MegaChil _gp1012 [Megavirus chiliensis]AFX93122.1 hypothetical protein CE11_01096 [Megavirus courdo11]AGD92986.1 hypothetical protein LBA_01068 [Megavirus lba]AVG46731.1 hypothetical protein [Acanthamoeba polyphaga mimivirus]AEQ32497.1 hypothetical protein [Megavirus chiliensis]AVG47850.1 hypothetical protein [Acanthamoeba polyphaga mimivirus]